MKISQRPPKGFTLIELLVVITIIGILASLAMPGLTAALEKVNQSKVVSDGKQIYLALKMFAGDNDGIFPTKAPTAAGDLNSQTATYSNDIFKNLIPRYLPNGKSFYVAKSKWCDPTVPPLEVANTDLTANLPKKSNHFAYVTALNETSNGSFPLIADGFTEAGAADGTYTTEDLRGGLWKGRSAIIIRVDGSAKAEKCTIAGTASTVRSSIGAAGAMENIFSKTVPNWLTTANTAMNPDY